MKGTSDGHDISVITTPTGSATGEIFFTPDDPTTPPFDGPVSAIVITVEGTVSLQASLITRLKGAAGVLRDDGNYEQLLGQITESKTVNTTSAPTLAQLGIVNRSDLVGTAESI